jgi:YhgE/Pip-like protein
MSQKQPQKQARHAAPKPHRGTKSLRTVKFWLAPIVITLALMSALSALYLGGILNPTTNLRNFPIALVNQDAGPYGKQILDGLVSGLDKEKFDVRVVSQPEAKQLLDRAQVYGELVIPPGFSSRLADLGESALTSKRAERPSVTISTNQRAGTLASSIAGATLNQAMAVANSKVGERLSADVIAQAQGAPMAGAAVLALNNPIDVKTNVYNPLPNGTGNGSGCCCCWQASPAASWSARWWTRCSAMFRPNSARSIGSPSRSTSPGSARFCSSGES